MNNPSLPVSPLNTITGKENRTACPIWGNRPSLYCVQY